MRKSHSWSIILSTFLMMAVLISSAWAVPGYINYQGRLTDSDGLPIDNPTLNMTFRIFDSETNGTLLWEAVQTVDVHEGIYNVRFKFSEITSPGLFNNEQLYLEVEVDGESGPMTPRQRLTSVPFAMRAGTADKLGDMDPTKLQQQVWDSCGDGSSIKIIYPDGSVKCNNLADNATNAAHATTADSAASAAYADNAFSAEQAATANQARWADEAGLAYTLDSAAASAFASASHNHDAEHITNGTLHVKRYSAYDDLGAEGYLGNASGDLAQNNGVLQSGLNADLLDGNDAKAFSLANHTHTPGDEGHTHSTLAAPDGDPAEAVRVDSSGDVAIGTSSASGHQLNVAADVSGKSAVRGVDYDSFVSLINSEGLLGVESPAGLPTAPGSVGVLGRKTATGGEGGVAVYGWNSDDEAKNYAMYAVADGSAAASSNYAMYAVADGSPAFGANYAMYAVADGSPSNGINYGIYARAENGPKNWAGYFVGDVKTDGNVEVTGNVEAGGKVSAEGFQGTAADSGSYGVYGSNNPNGNHGYLGTENDGVYGEARFPSRSAVCGVASNTGSSPNFGGHFTAASEMGRGVFGKASAAGEVENYGGYFTAAGGNGRGVYGYASDWGSEMGPETTNYGGYFESAGLRGVGVYAKAANIFGTGIYAEGGPNGYAADLVGNVRISSVDTGHTIMELGEGLDYAEGFDVSRHQDAAPGSVLIIDPHNPGKLTLSTEPYDTKVAGIVAGAKGLGSGVRLGADQFDKDVALAGRVYCNVDATKEAVETGDLLTTSDTPGHAMKAVDYGRAQGAILGKAMQKLDKGKKGQILVLVTLQ